MVNVQPCKKCYQCNNAAPSTEENYRICHVHHLKVWAYSVACNEFDDSVVF